MYLTQRNIIIIINGKTSIIMITSNRGLNGIIMVILICIVGGTPITAVGNLTLRGDHVYKQLRKFYSE